MPRPDFDLCIIGGGAAGMEIARMAARAGLRLAVIEQGAANGRHIFQRMPLMVGKIIGNPRFVDAWQSTPQAGGAPRPVLAGRGLGGSSRINGNVAYAGPAERYSHVFGPLGLDFSTILNGLEQSNGQHIPRVHSWHDDLSRLFLKQCTTGQDPDKDFYIGAPLHVNTRRGWRYNHFDGWRTNSPHPTFYRAKADQLLFDDNGACGVQLCDGQKKVFATQTVLSAGAIGSPALLLRSGIGPKDQLKQANIECRLDQPNVGAHLKDHANLRIPFACPGYDTLNQKTRGMAALWEGVKFLSGMGDSILRGPGASTGVNIANGDDPFRIQLVHFTQDRSTVGQKGIVFEKTQGASLGMYPLWPHSAGSVQITKGGLRIDPGFLANDRDLETTQTALRHATDMITAMGFAAPEIEDAESFIKQGVYSGYHLIGSNRMANDFAGGVVGPDYKAHGMEGLSICDASVMPDHLSSHSYLPTIALARMFGHIQGWDI
ncbi:MAG: GMC family oxidoreductase [Planktomarina sp.]